MRAALRPPSRAVRAAAAAARGAEKYAKIREKTDNFSEGRCAAADARRWRLACALSAVAGTRLRA